MTVLYVAGKKIDKSGDTPKALYYAVPVALQKACINEKKLAKDMAAQSSLMAGDALSALLQLPNLIAEHLKNGRTVKIDGLGTFFLSVSSEGVESPEECRPRTIKKLRVCFKADKALKQDINTCEFQLMEE